VAASVRPDRDITITLTDAQIARVVLAASGGVQLAGTLSGVLSGIGSLDELGELMLPMLDDQTYSRATFRAAMVLAAFPADGSEIELNEIARTIGLSPSTTHRYARTWMVLGLLEQHPDTRRYRRNLVDNGNR
jgi:IclR helix-turn-helix domain